VGAGGRAAPPEDSGGIVDAESLAGVLDDPARFDAASVNDELRHLDMVLAGYGVDQRLVALTERLRFDHVGDDWDARLHAIGSGPRRPSDDELATALRPYLWFLDRAGDDGLELTSAGYHKPGDGVAASLVVPSMARWIGKNNRESLAAPLLDFRQSLQRLGLLRKHKGRLLLTRAAMAVRGDPYAVWDLLAGKLIPAKPVFDMHATLLLLAYVATSEGSELPLERVAKALGVLGWRSDGVAPGALDLVSVPAYATLFEMCEMDVRSRLRPTVSRAAAALARAALCR
jgi:hypothetical protein